MSTVLTTEVGEPPDSERALLSIQGSVVLSVEQVITRLFPAPTLGQHFYRHFLERSSREQTILPDEPADTVAICTQSIATLAKEIGMGGDTTQKYVVIYRALGLLKKRKVMGTLVFALRTGIYHPPDLLEANLEHLLQKSRRKLREMVCDVLARCKIYGLIAQNFQVAATLLHDLLQPQPGETRRTLEQRLLQARHVFGQILSSMQNLPKVSGPGDAEWFHLPAIEAGESPQTTATGRRDAHSVDRKLLRPTHQVDSTAFRAAHESPQAAIAGRFEQETPTENLPAMAKMVDSVQPHQAEESSHTPIQGRFEGEKPCSRLPQLPGEGDSTAGNSDTSPVESPQPAIPGRFGQETAVSNLLKSAVRVDSSDLVNVNVITFITTITSNVRHVAAFCCHALGEPLSKQPIYLKLFRECEYDAQAIAAALLFTLVHRRDGTMRNPASVFVVRCRDYHAQGVPDETAALVKQYGSLTYTQLVDALRKPAAFTPPARGASLPVGVPASPVSPSSLAPLPRWGTLPRLIGVDYDRTGMDRQEALQVIRRACEDRRTKLCRVDLEHLANGSYAVLLDNTITAVPRQTYFYSLHDWEARTAAIEDCFELFGVARSGRRRLADVLKARRVQR